MTLEEKAYELYPKKVVPNKKGTGEFDKNWVVRGAYMRGWREALDGLEGAQKMMETLMDYEFNLPRLTAWVARDEDGSLFLFFRDPFRKANGCWEGRLANRLDNELFPEVTWETAPKEIEILIKNK